VETDNSRETAVAAGVYVATNSIPYISANFHTFMKFLVNKRKIFYKVENCCPRLPLFWDWMQKLFAISRFVLQKSWVSSIIKIVWILWENR